MDILVSSNLERLLFELSGKDGSVVSGYMSTLSDSGHYEVLPSIRDETNRLFAGGWCSEDETLKTIADTLEKFDYLIDTHTSVAYKVLRDYRENTGDTTPTVAVSTASPYKFCESMLRALGKPVTNGGAELIDMLYEATGKKVPAPLEALRDKTPRFLECVPPDGMVEAVTEFLKG